MEPIVSLRPLRSFQKSDRNNHDKGIQEDHSLQSMAEDEKAGTLRLSVDNVKNIQQAKVALEGVVPKKVEV